MILELRMPYINRQIDDVSISEWHCKEGDLVQFGDDVLDVLADRVRLMKRQRSASFLKREKSTEAMDPEDRRFRDRTNVRFGFRVVASDSGYIRKIAAPEAGRVAIGDLLAIATTTPDEDFAETGGGEFRLVPNLLEGDEE